MKREIINADYEMRLVAVREVQSATGAPKGVLREGVAPVLWADVVIVPERSERDTVRAATIGSGRLRESSETGQYEIN